MPVSPSEFLQFAKTSINNKAETEFIFRNAASRAYYCAYHACKEFAATLPVQLVHEKGVHEAVAQTLFDNKQMALGYMLQQCKSVRVEADYHLNDTFVRSTAESLVESVERILEKISQQKTKITVP